MFQGVKEGTIGMEQVNETVELVYIPSESIWFRKVFWLRRSELTYLSLFKF